MWDRRPDTVEAAWRSATDVVAHVYGLAPKTLAQSTPDGRRARTPPAYWLPRKVAIFLAVAICDCTYAALARAIGMHRDTVTSQCGEIAAMAAEDRLFGRRIEALARRAQVRLAGKLATIREWQRLDAEHVDNLRLDRLPTMAPQPPPETRGRPTSVRQFRGGVSGPHENLIAFTGGPLE